MTSTKSQKILEWKTKDYVLNALTYVLNAVVIAILFLCAVHINGRQGEMGIREYLETPVTFVHFITLLVLTLAVMVMYFIYEDKNFLKNAANSEMLFLIVEISLVVCIANIRLG